MSKIILLISMTLLICGSVLALNSDQAALRRAPFTVVEEGLTRGELKLSVASSNFEQVKNGSPRQLLQLPVSISRTISLELERFEIIAPDARFLIGSDGREENIEFPDVVLFRGRIEGEANSSVFIAFSSTGMINGFVNGAGEERFALSTGNEDLNPSNPIVTLKPVAMSSGLEVPFCGADELSDWVDFQFDRDKSAPPDGAGPLLQRVAIDGNQKFVNLFSNTTEAFDYVVQVIGAVSAIYERDNNIRFALAFVRLWPSGGEPFSSTSVNNFRQYWWDNEDTSDLNIVHLLSGARNAPFGGIAYYSNTCDGSAYGIDAYLNGSFLTPVSFPENGNWDLNVIAHEMGHNSGAPHTHNDFYSPHIDECGNGVSSIGTIMSYCHIYQGYQRNIDLRFHRRVQETITGTVGPAGCQPRDCNGNNVGDDLDISSAASADVNSDGIPDECQDCNNNGTLDPIEIAGGLADIDGNGIPDECESDCDGNNLPDQFETWTGLADDVDGNNVPDDCDLDCDNNGEIDFIAINLDMALDLDRDRILDACQDCDGNLQPDWLDMERQYNLMVCDSFASNITEFHAQSGVITRQMVVGISNPIDVMVDVSGSFLFVANDGDQSVYRTDLSTGISLPFVASGTGGLVRPSALALGPAGSILVADAGGNAVRKYDASTGASLGDFVSSGSSPLVAPFGLTYGSDGNLYVTSSDHAVYKYNGATGAYLGLFVTPGLGGLSGPRDLVFRTNGNLLVTSYNNDQIIQYTSSGTLVGTYSDEYGYTDPWGLEIGPNGNIFVSVHNGSQGRIVELIEATGRYYRSFVRGAGILDSPNGFCFLPGSANDLNGNFVLDVCEPGDIDSDGHPDIADNCPGTSNAGQADSDGDGVGDACDNCPTVVNLDQRDVDADGIGDLCDNCPAVSNIAQTDSDSDGRGDGCDNCPTQANPTQADSDWDAIGDVCDACPNDFENDSDGDGHCRDADNCPDIANADQADFDNDGIGDLCDSCTDSDGDGFGNPGFAINICPEDNCPDTANADQIDSDGDGVGDACCCQFRGDVDNTGALDISDLTYFVAFLFGGGPSPVCPFEGDIDGSSTTDIADLTFLVAYFFGGGPVPPACP